jgi:enoyl-CoA hydratase/carnithine racemase
VIRNDDVGCVAVAATSDRALCVGIERSETIEGEEIKAGRKPGYVTPSWYDDPGRRLGPKSSEFWKPVIAGVNGMA